MINLRKIIKAYLLFALIHSLIKILSYFRQLKQATDSWKELPGENPDFAATELRKSKKKVHDFLVKDALEDPTKDLYKLPLPQPSLLCFSGKAVKWMLKDDFERITKEGKDFLPIVLLEKIFGSSNNISILKHGKLFPQDHIQWLKQRKTISSVFTRNMFKTSFNETFERVSNDIVHKIQVNNEKTIDIQKLFFDLTLKATEENFFGKRSSGKSRFQQLFSESQQLIVKITGSGLVFAHFVKAMLPFPFGSFFNNGAVSKYSTVGMFLFCTLNSEYRRFENTTKELHKELGKYVEETINDPLLGERTDLLSKFIIQSGDELNRKDISAITLSILLAGIDSIACTMSWLIYELTQNQEIQNTLLEEIDDKINESGLTFDSLSADNLPYLNGVLYEVLRLHPPIATDKRIAARDLYSPDGIFIPKDTALVVSPYGMGRNPLRYPEPEKLKPERWIPFKKPSEFDFPVFLGGPRICLGEDLAIFEVKYIIVRLLQSFRFDLKPGEADKIGYARSLIAYISNCKNKTTNELLVIPTQRN